MNRHHNNTMFTLPKQQIQLPWFQQASFKTWIRNVFRLSSRKRSYSLMLADTPDLAWVDRIHKVFHITHNLPEIHPEMVMRHDPGTEYGRRIRMLLGFTVHEAAHVRHSPPTPFITEHAKRFIWNAIEDERIERLMVKEFPEMEPVFTFMGDMIMERNHLRTVNTGKPFAGKAMEGVLCWRFEHDKPEHRRRWHIHPAKALLWHQIKPLIEEAWETNDPYRVIRITDQIYRLMMTHDEEIKEARKLMEQVESENTQSGPSPLEVLPEDPSDQALPSEEQTVPENTGSQQGQQSTSETTEQDGEGETKAQSAEESASADQQEPHPPTSEELGKLELEEENNELIIILVSASGAGETVPAEGDDEDKKGGNQNVVTASESKGKGSKTKLDIPEDTKVTVIDQRDQQEKQNQNKAQNEDGDDEAGQEEVGSIGKQAGYNPDALPFAPNENVNNIDVIAKGVEGYARMLAPLLHPKEKPKQKEHHRSKGRFDYSRSVKGYDKTFTRKTGEGKKSNIFLELLIDHSGSMGEEELTPAKDAAIMLLKAAALGGSRARIIAFDDVPTPVVDRPMPYLDAVARVNAIRSRGGTQLSNALKYVFEKPMVQHDERHVVVVICDGYLEKSDYAMCESIVRAERARGSRFIPILISDATENREEWRDTFGSAIPCSNTDEIAKMIKSVLTSINTKK